MGQSRNCTISMSGTYIEYRCISIVLFHSRGVFEHQLSPGGLLCDRQYRHIDRMESVVCFLFLERTVNRLSDPTQRNCYEEEFLFLLSPLKYICYPHSWHCDKAKSASNNYFCNMLPFFLFKRNISAAVFLNMIYIECNICNANALSAHICKFGNHTNTAKNMSVTSLVHYWP